MSIRKIDPNWFADPNEATAAIDALAHEDVPLLVVFLHSFSLMKEGGEEGRPVLNRRSRDIFRAILVSVAEKRLPVMSMRDLTESKTVRVMGQYADVIPRVGISVGLHYYLWHRFRAAATGGATVSLAILPFLTTGGVLFVVWWRRRDRPRSAPRGASSQ
jgi:hypothetical protein